MISQGVTQDPHGVNGAVTYQYDTVGNRQIIGSSLTPITTQPFAFDANDRINTANGYTYDNAGNTLTDPNGTYTYDSLDRMTSATVNGVTTTYVYDGDGNKVSQTVNGTTTNYLIDSNNLTGYAQVVDELQGGSVNRTYTYGTSRIAEDQFNGSSWNMSYYGYDGQGSVRYLMDGTGTVTDTYDYDAFGNLLNQTGTTANVFKYDGEEQSPNTGFYNLRARWMNPGIGRFQMMDSFDGDQEDPLTLNKYSFSENNPENRIDPSGYDDYDLSSAIGITAQEPKVLWPKSGALNGIYVEREKYQPFYHGYGLNAGVSITLAAFIPSGGNSKLVYNWVQMARSNFPHDDQSTPPNHIPANKRFFDHCDGTANDNSPYYYQTIFWYADSISLGSRYKHGNTRASTAFGDAPGYPLRLFGGRSGYITFDFEVSLVSSSSLLDNHYTEIAKFKYGFSISNLPGIMSPQLHVDPLVVE